MEQREHFLPLAPEFVVELRSPSDGMAAIEARVAAWRAAGVILGGLIDPERRLVKVYRRSAEPDTLLEPKWLEGEGPVAGFRLRMRSGFGANFPAGP